VTAGIPFAKGHGTENDFVIIPDFEGEYDLTADQVRAVCDRRAGIGADGILRMIPAAKHAEGVAHAATAAWFMDYRNADGSIAEMCGNGARLFAHFLVTEGLADSGVIPIATRDGVKSVEVRGSGGSATLELQLPTLGSPTTVEVAGRTLAGRAAYVGNPHVVCVVDVPLSDLDLTAAPVLDAELFPEGGNVELITPPETAGGQTLRIGMRVYERGSGETRSCGTGAVAAAAVALAVHTGDPGKLSGGEVQVNLPGGELIVRLTESAAFLTGPAVIVATGRFYL
jgi:diaminopimelate epimerase